VRRRTFIKLLGSAAAWPLEARAQELVPGARSTDRPARIALVSFVGAAVGQPYGRALRDGLRSLGWLEGRNLTIDERFAEGEDQRLPAIVDEILRINPQVVIIDGARVVRTFRERAAAIPIVTAVVSDPVGAGFIASFARPGGNVTGVAFQDSELITKRVELLKELVPGLARFALLNDPGARAGAPDTISAAAGRAVHALGLVPHIIDVRHIADLTPALDSAHAHGDQAVLQVSSPFFSANRGLLVAQALRLKLPLSCEQSAFVAVGCLVSYGPSFHEMHRRAAFYVDRILKGEAPANLPVELPTKFDLAINLKTAKALGLDVPQTLLARADEVIE
jgi:putative tryptophan/tyrosine transport system substrate-binding protein